MSKLILSEYKGENNWTLKPEQQYIIGSNKDCNIYLPEKGLANQQLKFRFSSSTNRWHVYNLDNTINVFIDNKPWTEYTITKQCFISVGQKFFLLAVPENYQINTSGHSSPILEMKNPNLRGSVEPKRINSSLFDKEDPNQLRGFWLRDFSFSFNRLLSVEDQSTLELIRADLYQEICERLKQYQNQNTQTNRYLYKLIWYKDTSYPNDRERIYLELIYNTIRKTKITTLFRFFVNGSNLYLASDSYVLARLKRRNLLFHFLFTCIVIVFIITSFPNLPIVPILFIPMILAVWYLYSTWIKVIRAISQGESFSHALRINFPKNIKGNAFNLDDIYMFLKSIYPLVISSLETTLKKYELLDDDLSEILKDIKKDIGSTTINIDTRGGGIFGAIFGGNNNTINN